MVRAIARVDALSPGSANRCRQVTCHPGRTSSPLRPSLSFRYTQPRDPVAACAIHAAISRLEAAAPAPDENLPPRTSSTRAKRVVEADVDRICFAALASRSPNGKHFVSNLRASGLCGCTAITSSALSPSQARSKLSVTGTVLGLDGSW
jgi:hypothetical protein